MNLIENIQRINTLISEDKKEDTIRRIIDKMGLADAIKLMGGYERILNTIGHEYFTNDDKIDFIRETISHLVKKYNTTGISIDELNMSPITIGDYDPYDLEFQQIEYFNPDSVTIGVYNSDSLTGSFAEKYESLDDNTLDNVFIFMIDALEDNM